MKNVPLNLPIEFSLSLQSGANASGPGSHARSGFFGNSLKLPTGGDAFILRNGVTVSGGNYLVRNHASMPQAIDAIANDANDWSNLRRGACDVCELAQHNGLAMPFRLNSDAHQLVHLGCLCTGSRAHAFKPG